MSISYQPKDAAVQGLQLKVQELVLKASDAIVDTTTSAGDTIIDLKETISKDAGVKLALLCLDAGGVSKVADADVKYPESVDTSVNPPVPSPSVPGGKKIKLEGVSLGADDVLVLKYSV
jgi:hypothetical protein